MDTFIGDQLIKQFCTPPVNRAFLFPALVVVNFMAGCSGSSEPADVKTLADCYKSEFGTLPPATVGSLQAKQVIIGDAGGQWLRFTADAETISSILSKGFEPSNKARFLSETCDVNRPAWWRPSTDSLTTFYSHPKWTKHFGKEAGGWAYLAHDANQKLVYFMSSASN